VKGVLCNTVEFFCSLKTPAIHECIVSFFSVFQCFSMFFRCFVCFVEIQQNTRKTPQNTRKTPQNTRKTLQNTTKHHKTHLLTKQPEFANKSALARVSSVFCVSKSVMYSHAHYALHLAWAMGLGLL